MEKQEKFKKLQSESIMYNICMAYLDEFFKKEYFNQKHYHKKESKVLYQGDCPSINEFRKIVKLLNV